jgi:hypothetical protein
MSDPYEDMFGPCTAHTLIRVVPIAAKESAAGVTVALTALEIYQDGNGVLRYLLSLDSRSRRKFEVLPGPHIEIEDDTGRTLPVELLEDSASGRTASGLFQIAELPESGNLEVRILRIAGSKRFFDIGDFAWEGPWAFQFCI